VLIKVFSPAYFAREDTATPMLYASLSLTANTLGSMALFFLFRSVGLMPHLGIALATTLGGWLNAWLLYRTLRERGHFVPDARLKRALPLMLAASLVMGALLLWIAVVLQPWLASTSAPWLRLSALCLLVGCGAGVYGLLIIVTQTLPVRQWRTVVRRNRSGP
jgi:putative peptidoglycan lipid II flippase